MLLRNDIINTIKDYVISKLSNQDGANDWWHARV